MVRSLRIKCGLQIYINFNLNEYFLVCGQYFCRVCESIRFELLKEIRYFSLIG